MKTIRLAPTFHSKLYWDMHSMVSSNIDVYLNWTLYDHLERDMNISIFQNMYNAI